MKGKKKIIHKIVALTMTFSLLSPMVLSSGVMAAEYSNSTSEVSEDKQDEIIAESKESHDQEGLKENEEPANAEGLNEDVEENNKEMEDSSIKGDNNYNQKKNEEKPEMNVENSIKVVEEDTKEDMDSSKEETEEDIEYFSYEETRDRAVVMMEEEQNSKNNYGAKTRSVSKTEAFINAVSSVAGSVAKENNLYASVMIAQAALESAWGTSILAYVPNHNLFGIKGNYNGQSFSKYTKEYSKENGWTTIKADFRKYPSYKESFIDNADKLRNGINSDKNFYKGTWKENAKSYKDATAWLEGRYATDPDYANKLNNIIQTYNLTQFDTTATKDPDANLEADIGKLTYDEVVSTKNVDIYEAIINGNSDGIYTQPKGTSGSKVISAAAEYFNKKVTVSQEKVTKNGLEWGLISLNGKELGWIDKNDLTKIDVITSQKDINYNAMVKRGTDNITTKPYGTKDYKVITKSSKYLKQEVKITKEAVTGRATWALISIGGKTIGWMDKNGLDVERILSSKNVSYQATINRKTDTINTVPWGTEGYKVTARSSEYYNQEVTVIKEAVTKRATWVLVSLNGKELGWIDKNALTQFDVITSQKAINYNATVKRGTDNITTEPYGTKDYKVITKSSKYLNQEVKVIKEAITSRATWSLISSGGKTIGWIDKNGLDFERILSSKNAFYQATINRKTDTINTVPWGTEGYELTARSSEYYDEEITVTQEAVTKRATWALISLNGKELGWIDKKGLTQFDVITSQKDVNYNAIVKRGTDNITTKPYGTKGYNIITKSSKYLNQEVKVIKEAVTSRATWALVSVGGKTIGWMDKNGLDVERVLSSKDTTYKAIVNRKTDTINTVPWGTEGYEVTARSSEYYNQEVTVIKEAVTKRATWALISIEGKTIGWMDKNGLDVERILSSKNISYQAIINRNTDTINTAPWGTEGYKVTAKSSEYYKQEVIIVKEAVTKRATWALIKLNGKELGWIDKSGLDIEKVTKTTNVMYNARINRGSDSINTLPWGTEGYKVTARSSQYMMAKVKVTQEKVTKRATWALISLNGKTLGWIDKAALKVLNPSQLTIYVDAGHGGKDNGASAGGVKEKDLNLTVALKVQNKLKAKGYEVIMSRTTDVFLELAEIASKANNADPDIFVSIHTNASGFNANGIETYSYDATGNLSNPLSRDPQRLLESSMLSSSIQKALIQKTSAYDRGAKRADFHVIRQTEMPAVLVEMGFIDNNAERAKLITNVYQEKIADGIVQGIVDYYK